jgi:Mn2+/Fe2+ NRAMP family transporter
VIVPATSNDLTARRRRSALGGAAFLMATSAIGPGFLTQTAVFTEQLGASFGFVILASIALDLGAQLNIWRVIAVTGRRAQDLANSLLPGLGHGLAVLVATGGLAFNVGNVAGAGLGLNVVTGIGTNQAAVGSAALAIALFAMPNAARAMDRFAQAMGVLMIALTVYVAVQARPPVGAALLGAVAPERIDLFAILTLVGGTVGGYITFAGGHRLIDAGVAGAAALPHVTRSAVVGIAAASAMRVLLFLAALGVVTHGLSLDPANPPASVFRLAAGEVGYRLFGVVMWAAAATSIVGASYTSVSFLRSMSPLVERHVRACVILFVVSSTMIFLAVGRPVQVLVIVGALNALVLPAGLCVMLIVAHRPALVAGYRHPRWLTIAGVLTAALTAWLALWSLAPG